MMSQKYTISDFQELELHDMCVVSHQIKGCNKDTRTSWAENNSLPTLLSTSSIMIPIAYYAVITTRQNNLLLFRELLRGYDHLQIMQKQIIYQNPEELREMPTFLDIYFYVSDFVF